MIQNAIFLLALIGCTNYVNSRMITIGNRPLIPSRMNADETKTLDEKNCTIDVIIGQRAFVRNRLMLSRQVYAAKFDQDDNLFVIYDNAYGDFIDGADVRISVLWNGNNYAENILEIDPEAFPEAIAVDKNGKVLVATNQGLYTFDKPTNKIIPYMLPEVDLRDVTIAQDNTVFVVENLSKKVYKIDKDAMVAIRNFTSDYNLYIDNKNNIYFDNGLNTYFNKGVQLYKIKGPLAFTDITMDAENRIYAVNELGLWFSRNGPLGISKVKSVGTPASSVTVDSKGNVVIGEEESLLQLKYVGQLKTLKKKCGEFFNVAPCLFCDIFYN